MKNDVGIEVIDLNGYAFEDWLDEILRDYKLETFAFNFNLYDTEKYLYSAELVACPSYDENDDDWACEEIYASRDHFTMHLYYSDNKVMAYARLSNLVKKYIEAGKYADVLRAANVVACGFIDEPLTVLYRKKANEKQKTTMVQEATEKKEEAVEQEAAAETVEE